MRVCMVVWTAAAAFSGLFIVSPATAADDLRIAAVDRSRYPDIGITVVVPESLEGEDLPPDAFLVEEGHAEHAVQKALSPAGADMEVVLLVGTPPAAGDERTDLQSAIVEFVLGLPAGTRVALVGAGDRPRVITPLTDDMGTQISNVKHLPSVARGSIFDAILPGLEQFSDRPEVLRALVLLAVGPTAPPHTAQQELQDSLDAAGVSFYGVQEQPAPTMPFEPPLGGHVATVNDTDDLPGAFDEILRELRRQYHLTYHSSARGVTDLRVSINNEAAVLATRSTVSMPAALADIPESPPGAPAGSARVDEQPGVFDSGHGYLAALVIGLLLLAVAVMVRSLQARHGPGLRSVRLVWSATVVRFIAHRMLSFATGLAIGLAVFGIAVIGGVKLLVPLALVLLGSGLIAVFGAERVFVGAILLNLPLQLDVYLGWREEEGALSALAGLPISLTTVGVVGLLGWRVLMGMSLRPSASLRGLWARRTWMSLSAFVALSAGSILFADDVPFAFNELALLIQSMVLYGYLSAALRRLDLRWVLDLLLVGLIFEGLVMASQALGVATLGATVWTADAGTQVVERASGMLGSPNSAATYLSVLGIIALATLLWETRSRRTLLPAIALLMSVGGLALTLSRGGLLAFGAGVVVFVILGVRQQRLTAHSVVAIGAALCVVIVVAGNSLLLRVVDDAGAAQGRVPLQEIAWEMIRSAPLTGVGLNNFVIALPDFLTPRFSDAWLSIVHNQYLLTTAESGVLGLGAFLTFIGLAIRTAWEVAAKHPHSRDVLLALGVLAALVARVVHMFFDVFNGPVQWDTLVIIAALGTALYERAAAADHSVVASRAPQSQSADDRLIPQSSRP